MNKEEFVNSVKNLNISINEEIIKKLDIYAKFLLEYNEHTNLTAIKNIEDIYCKHFYDSLTISKVIDLNECETLLDFGTGAGFPGMVLKIFFPNLKVTLVDSNNKKTKFLFSLCDKLGLNDVNIINDRVENLWKEYLNYFDCVTARAVSNMSVLTELAMPLVKEDKYFVAMKGSNKEEIDEALYAVEKMKGIIDNIATFTLYENCGERNIVKIKKISKSKLDNLRSYDKIIKKPLKNS